MQKVIQHITDKIISIEQENKLFDWQINNVFIWELLRYKIYSSVMIKAGGEDHSPFIKHRKILSLKNIVEKTGRLINAIYYNPFLDYAKSDILVFESSRKLRFNEQYIDPYTKFIVDDLRKRRFKVTQYQSSYSYDKLSERDFSIKHLDLIYFISLYISRFFKLKFSDEETRQIKKIERTLNNEFDMSFDLIRLIRKEILIFKNTLFYFEAILKKKKPIEIYIVNFCDKTALICAAKRNNIKVIDIQHGLISSSDIIYHYPNIKEGSLKYFPDQFYIWSKIWKETCKIPIKESDIIVYGNRYLDAQSKKYLHVIKRTNQILIVSQPSLTKLIATAILNYTDQLKDYQVLYKLHPAEYENAQSFPELNELKKIANISFVSKLENFYEKLAESKFVIGIYSTALIEAISFQCQVLLLDLPGVEMMKPFIDNKMVKMYTPECLHDKDIIDFNKHTF
ncbi:MAG: hypothetical protein AB7G44_00805 [Bacteroidia bacterium]